MLSGKRSLNIRATSPPQTDISDHQEYYVNTMLSCYVVSASSVSSSLFSISLCTEPLLHFFQKKENLLNHQNLSPKYEKEVFNVGGI